MIARHFPRAHTFLLPKVAVLAAARELGMLDAFDIGIHPERVLKLVRSTDVYPAWLASQEFTRPQPPTTRPAGAGTIDRGRRPAA